MIKNIKKRIKDRFYKMIKEEPDFEKFIKDIESKSLEEIAMEFDLDYEFIKQFI